MKKFNKIFYSFLFLFLAVALFSLNLTSTQAEEKPKKEKPHKEVCGFKGDDVVRCHARVVTDDKGNPQVAPFASSPAGYGPAQFRGAYNLGGASSSGRILAIVDAFDHPNIKSDLDVYSSTFGLSILPDCSGLIKDSLIPCFQKLAQDGSTNYPTVVDQSWALEIALDVEVAHAVCPDCKILLVEANDNTYGNLMSAIDQAVSQGAAVVSNSYGSGEFSSETFFDSHFKVPGIAFTFSSGDSGYGTGYPAASRYVTAVGGTTLYVNSDNSYNSEVVWSGTGSGCSLFESKPGWQTDRCPRRTIADVSADADPNTGAAVYDTVSYFGQTGWFQVGGTSLSSPIIAAVYALKGVPTGVRANSLPYLNSPSTNLHDVIYGNNGGCNRRAKYLCTARVGYDGPTGLGTPKGIDAF